MKDYWIYIWECAVIIGTIFITGSVLTGLIAGAVVVFSAMLGMIHQRTLIENRERVS